MFEICGFAVLALFQLGSSEKNDAVFRFCLFLRFPASGKCLLGFSVSLKECCGFLVFVFPTVFVSPLPPDFCVSVNENIRVNSNILPQTNCNEQMFLEPYSCWAFLCTSPSFFAKTCPIHTKFGPQLSNHEQFIKLPSKLLNSA